MVVRKRLPIRGQALVFVTTTVADWLPVFGDPHLAVVIMDKLQSSAKHFSVAVVGYVLMPSHLHMLLGFPQIERLSRFMQSFKILSAKAVKQSRRTEITQRLWHDGAFRLWKPRFDDLVIVTDQQLRIKLNYIHENPVKAGLVSSPCDWPYSSAPDWLSDKRGPVDVDKDFRWME